MIWHNVGHQYKHANTNTTIRHEPYYTQLGARRGRDRMVVDLQLPVQ